MTSASHDLDALYGDWFLDYASYVILERAVPHIEDGLKPVQRRIMHSLKEKDDGRFNKVANIVGHTMQYHPHGDSAIADAMVQLGQKNLLIETQGNWGNVLTGDPPAASRYIEARVSNFAKDVLFNNKTTTWAASYDGRNKEPVTLPSKFPILLAQGAEGIAVGLACKMLPHNFNELIDACIDALRKKPVHLLPDFPLGGIADCREYNEGKRGGKVRVRARIKITKKNLLTITEVPYGVTTTSLADSITAANDKGKIKVSKVEDITAEKAEIRIHLPAGSDPDAILQALYAFTDCEISISPNACVIEDNKPKFLSVNEILKQNALRTRDLLLQELEIRLHELEEKWHFSSLEKIFIEKRIYRDIEECTTWEAVIKAIDDGLKPYKKLFKRKITEDDIVRLTEIRIKRISKYDSFRADEEIKNTESAIEETKKNIKNITRYTVAWFKDIKSRYGKGRERKTELTRFNTVTASTAAVATENLYVNADTGFAGYAMKGEKIGPCSRLDNILVICRDGTMKVTKVTDKAFVGKDPVHVAVFQKDDPSVYHLVYRDGRQGRSYLKRFKIGGVTRDKIYELTKGTKSSRIHHLAIYPDEKTADAQSARVVLKKSPRLRTFEWEFDWAAYDIKGRGAAGNILTPHPVERITRIKSGG
ncbi:MAG: DNA gyrase/topoisomerase IV subunit A [Verrucomicrobiota bacterium]